MKESGEKSTPASKNYRSLKTSGFAIFFMRLLVMDLNQ